MAGMSAADWAFWDTWMRAQRVLVRELESLGPLARRCADEADVFGSLPAAHHFGHR